MNRKRELCKYLLLVVAHFADFPILLHTRTNSRGGIILCALNFQATGGWIFLLYALAEPDVSILIYFQF